MSLYFPINCSKLLNIFTFLQCNGDIEPNPGPRKLKQNSFSIFLLNLKSLSAHNFTKLTQLDVSNSLNRHDFACLLETYLDSTTHNNLVKTEGCNLKYGDYPEQCQKR